MKRMCEIGMCVAVLAMLWALKCFEMGALGWADTLINLCVMGGMLGGLVYLRHVHVQQVRREAEAARRSAWKESFFREVNRFEE